jgi:hypothetical protein
MTSLLHILNKYLSYDIVLIILDIHYKNKYNECMNELVYNNFIQSKVAKTSYITHKFKQLAYAYFHIVKYEIQSINDENKKMMNYINNNSTFNKDCIYSFQHNVRSCEKIYELNTLIEQNYYHNCNICKIILNYIETMYLIHNLDVIHI